MPGPRRNQPQAGICTYCKKRRCAGRCQRPICKTCGRKHYGDCEGVVAKFVRETKARQMPTRRRDELNSTERCILDSCRRLLAVNGYGPAIREIQADCGISSTSVVGYNLNGLEAKGYITRSRDRRIARSIRLTPKAEALYAEQ